MFFKKRGFTSPNNHTGMTDAELEEYERMYPDRVQTVDVEKLFHDIEHPLEANLNKAKAISQKFDISLSEALELLKLKKLNEIESFIQTLPQLYRHF